MANTPNNTDNDAANLIRGKLAKIYASEPDALQEEREAEIVKPRSKHQQFMFDLNHSGKNLAQIQTEWHNYYLALPDDEKHIVWQEFYASNDAANHANQRPAPGAVTETEHITTARNQLGGQNQSAKKAHEESRNTSQIQKDIRRHANRKAQSKSRARQHLQSLMFGLGIGAITVIIFLFGFFNEIIIAPFIQPARTAADTPLIVSSDTIAPSADPQVIIPKINVQIPIQFDINATDEETMQKELESGVAHYPTTAMPGQNGNSAYFGHSSNNIFNKGKYKFAFVLLHELVPGDTFYITKDSKIYAYKVFEKRIVEPNQVEILEPIPGHTATATLITCDPPGTSLRRLVIFGDQISPEVSGNTTASVNTDIIGATQLTGNGQTLWGRFVASGEGKVVLGILVLGTTVFIFRKTSKGKQ